MPRKNPYLSQYKKNISSQQESLRKRLGVQTSFEDRVKQQQQQSRRLDNELEMEDGDEIPTIDEEDIFSNAKPARSAATAMQSGPKAQVAANLPASSERSGPAPARATSRASTSDAQYQSTRVARERLETPPPPPPLRPLTTSFSSLAKDELELAKSSSQRASPAPQPKARAPSTVVDSPIPSESFSRKPLYNSLLRAHDSIRLKVNRPKVRPRSASGETPMDTELDDSMQLVEISNEGGDQAERSSERSVDVRRQQRGGSSRSAGKATSKGPKTREPSSELEPQGGPKFSEIRVVKIDRSESERALGITVKAQDGHVVVARILAGSLAEQQGALQAGDLILAVNGRDVDTPEQLREQLARTIGQQQVLLKIVPSYRDELQTMCIYLRALFQYEPSEDSLLPCKELGVPFAQGDILEVVNQEDPNWWQARRVDSDNMRTGLIPSQELEERRRAFVLPDYDLATRTSICGTKVSKKSKKEIYNVCQNNDFDKAELQLYEEVCRTPAFERRSLVLIGANGVGKQAFKHRLVSLYPERFGAPLPHTSRLPRDGEENAVHYHFVTRERMEEDILAGKYLEYGEFDGALYGTKLDSIREIIGSGRVCVLDCGPTCLKVLKTSDYLPFVAFIGAPTLDQLRYAHEQGRHLNKTYATLDRALSRQSKRAKTLEDFAFDFFEDEDLQQTVEESARLFRFYENYFDIVLVNNNFETTFEQLRDALDALSMAPQWIPISWIYGA